MPRPVIPWARASLLAAILAASPTARAQAPIGPDPFAWLGPAAEDQLLDDDTVIPLGKGALFVPAVTDPLNEPPVILVDGDEVRDLPTGERVIVDPGEYVVIVTSGTPAQGVGQSVVVTEAETTLVPVTWGALRIEVTDDKRVPHRGSYEIIRSDTRQPYGTGFGADTFQGEQLQTWLLPPGVYRIVKLGGNYRARRNFATVYIPEGGFVRYRLVTDPTTGDILGSGVLLPDEFGSPKDGKERWFRSLILGVDGSFSQQRGNLLNQITLGGDLFIDGQLAYNRDDHHAVLLGQVTEGATRVDPRDTDPYPVIKHADELRADFLYTWYVLPNLGPYARAAAETQAFATDQVFAEPTNVAVLRPGQDPSGPADIESQLVDVNEPFRISDPWKPTVIREGAGLNTRLVSSRWVSLNFRLGLGLRQNRWDGVLLVDDDPDTPATVDYRTLESIDQQGLESTVVATVRLPGWVVYATNVELFADFGTLDQPSVEWRNTLQVRLTRNLSLNYRANLDYLPQTLVENAQIEQQLQLRAAWAIF